ncbi:hypothetical protein GQ651_08770 [Alphaproteobacteria bacterium GH1-50]|uniref:Uncharacterized protein n=1 Tax=Kangsaoukella pontilimi TaxID=2691042 RepID=A0A7C9MR25_9RHOB|nr:GvpL/GvpF family gas vesicle protein [Kangsaoukella pontilimi]MXQ07937.1 hypothetical protein [Kangsaoukella pontilimi]
MRRELLAILPGHPDLPPLGDCGVVQDHGFTAIHVPPTPLWIRGKMLRQRRLEEAPARQKLLEGLMPSGTVLPFAPGNVIEIAQMPDLLNCNRDMLDGLARRLSSVVQYQVSVGWDAPRVLERFRDAPEIVPLFSDAAVSGPALSSAVTRLAQRLGREISARLEGVARELVELPCGANMIANAAVLVGTSEDAGLDAALSDIDAIWTEGFRIRQVGPGPAVSFATLQLHQVSASGVAAAFERLGVKAPGTPDGVREARQALLRKPDCDAAAIRHAARIALAAGSTASSGPIALIDTWSEGVSVTPGLEAVA